MFFKNSDYTDKAQVPAQFENRELPDGLHVFHAYIDKGYCWVSVKNTQTRKYVGVHSIKIQKGWKRSLFSSLGHANTKYRDRTPEKHAKGARFYRSEFVPT